MRNTAQQIEQRNSAAYNSTSSSNLAALASVSSLGLNASDDIAFSSGLNLTMPQQGITVSAVVDTSIPTIEDKDACNAPPEEMDSIPDGTWSVGDVFASQVTASGNRQDTSSQCQSSPLANFEHVQLQTGSKSKKHHSPKVAAATLDAASTVPTPGKLAAIMGFSGDESRVRCESRPTNPATIPHPPTEQFHLCAHNTEETATLLLDKDISRSTQATSSPTRCFDARLSTEAQRSAPEMSPSSASHHHASVQSQCHSVLSSVPDEEMAISPDVTVEQASSLESDFEREVIVIEMDEDQSRSRLGQHATHDDCFHNVAQPFDDQSWVPALETILTPHDLVQQHQQVSDWTPPEEYQFLEPVEEVTEEPTYFDSSVEDALLNHNASLPVSSSAPHPNANSSPLAIAFSDLELIKSPSITARRNTSVQTWAQLHGLGTPSSASSARSSTRYGWADVIRCTTRSPVGAASAIRLSLGARSPLAGSWHASPARLIGLQNNFWASSPPELTLQRALLYSEEKRNSRLTGFLTTRSPSTKAPKASAEPSNLVNESDWFEVPDNTAADGGSTVACAAPTLAKRRTWKLWSKHQSATSSLKSSELSSQSSRLTKSRSPTNSPARGLTEQHKRRSSASVQSLLNAIGKRGSAGSTKTMRTKQATDNGDSYCEGAKPRNDASMQQVCEGASESVPRLPKQIPSSPSITMPHLLNSYEDCGDAIAGGQKVSDSGMSAGAPELSPPDMTSLPSTPTQSQTSVRSVVRVAGVNTPIKSIGRGSSLSNRSGPSQLSSASPAPSRSSTRRAKSRWADLVDKQVLQHPPGTKDDFSSPRGKMSLPHRRTDSTVREEVRRLEWILGADGGALQQGSATADRPQIRPQSTKSAAQPVKRELRQARAAAADMELWYWRTSHAHRNGNSRLCS